MGATTASRRLSEVHPQDIRLILLRFAFTNPLVAPECIWEGLECEVDEGRHKPQETIPQGRLVINPAENVDVLPFLAGLGRGYTLSDLRFQQRTGRHDQRSAARPADYYVMSFVFCDRQHAAPSQKIRGMGDELQKALQRVCEEAFWRVRAFLNPFCTEGTVIPEKYALSINLELRNPRYDGNGVPMKTWLKDKNGQRKGSEAVPIKPDSVLVFQEQVIEVVPAAH